MPFPLTFLLSQSVVIPVGIGLIRIKNFDKQYLPFFLLLIAALAAEEVSSYFIINLKVTNAPVIKIYSLIECMCILYQFYLWQKTARNRLFFIFLGITCATLWFIEHILFLNINTFSPYFRVFYAFVIVLLAINQVNAIVVGHDGVLFKNAKFILCLAFIIFFIYQIILEASFYIGSDKSAVANKIIIGFAYINFLVNLLYAVALFFITRKSETYNRYLP